MTLIELLVVIIILTTIVAAAIPLMSPNNDDRRLREAARGLNTFITGAQARAIALNRPYGIALKRLSKDTKRQEDNGVCLEVFYVEQPPAYAGFDANSCARVALYAPANSSTYGGIRPLVLVQFVATGNSVANNMDGLPVGWDPDLFPDGMVRPGDMIEISGTRYRLLSDSKDGDVVARFTSTGYFASDTGKAANNKATQIVAHPMNDTGQQINIQYDDWGAEVATPTPGRTHTRFFTAPARYKVLRQPTLASDEPYQLPEGTAIDLRASGVGSGDYFYVQGIHDNDQDVQILFTPEGRVAQVTFSREPNTPDPFDAGRCRRRKSRPRLRTMSGRASAGRSTGCLVPLSGS
jgi:type II secretory pathway pseudopilin PulG